MELKRIEELGFQGNFHNEYLQSDYHNNDLTEQEESDLNYYGSTILSHLIEENSLGEVYKNYFLWEKSLVLSRKELERGKNDLPRNQFTNLGAISAYGGINFIIAFISSY